MVNTYMKVSIAITNRDYQWALRYFIPSYLISMGIEFEEDQRCYLRITDEIAATALMIAGLPDHITDFTEIIVEND